MAGVVEGRPAALGLGVPCLLVPHVPQVPVLVVLGAAGHLPPLEAGARGRGKAQGSGGQGIGTVDPRPTHLPEPDMGICGQDQQRGRPGAPNQPSGMRVPRLGPSQGRI